MENPVFVLVHGAWGGSWCWRDLVALFTERHVDVHCVDLPSSRVGATASVGLEDDVRELARATSGLERVVLVGHSYGGVVITEAAPRIESIERLVYVAALVPLVGESATDVSRVVRVRTELDDAIEVDGDHLRLNNERAGSALYGECSPETRQWAVSQLSTQTIASFRSPRTSLATGRPTFYIKCRNDRAIDPGLQKVLATRCDEHLELASDHSPFLSHPQELLHALLD
ncbi:MAG: alpha/beta fold hydrolase [Acidimicrobiales bacterium]